MSETSQTFWEHLDDLRSALLKSGAMVVVLSVVAFLFKDELFAIVLAPRDSGFVTYRMLERIGALWAWGGSGSGDPFSVELINTGLARQFMIHMKTALTAGVLLASPYIIYQLFRFVSPALYADERSYATRVTVAGYVMSLLGVAASYFVIFPLTFRFLGTYQVSPGVSNLISLDSYMEVLSVMSLSMGIVFEMPVVAWLFARLGLLNAEFMKSHRRHAVVLILVIAAVITPTSDIFTLLAVSAPMCLLYEGSVWLVKLGARRKPEAVTA